MTDLINSLHHGSIHFILNHVLGETTVYLDEINCRILKVSEKDTRATADIAQGKAAALIEGIL